MALATTKGGIHTDRAHIFEFVEDALPLLLGGGNLLFQGLGLLQGARCPPQRRFVRLQQGAEMVVRLAAQRWLVGSLSRCRARPAGCMDGAAWESCRGYW